MRIRSCIVSMILCHAWISCRTVEMEHPEIRPQRSSGRQRLMTAQRQNFDIQSDRSVIGFLNELSYLMTVDEKRFAESINRLGLGDFF